MRRRDFITVAAGATAWVAAARAQGLLRVGFLGSGSHLTFPGAPAAFVQGLEDGGFVEGKNVSIEWRWAEGQYNRLPSLVSGGVTVIVGGELSSHTHSSRLGVNCLLRWPPATRCLRFIHSARSSSSAA